MRYVGHYIAAILLLCAVSGCAVNPVTGRQELMLITSTQEVELGKNSDPDIRWQFGGVYKDAQLEAYVNDVGQHAAAVSHRTDISYHFAVVDSSVANAFALPGGYIYITRGLLIKLENEAQLASVLGHEIGHVTARHGAKRLTNTLGFNLGLLVVDQVASGKESYRKWRGLIMTSSSILFATVSLGYGRKDEFQADELGTSYAYKAGYEPEGMVQLLEVLKSMHSREPSSVEVFFSSHPRSSDRIAAVGKQIAQLPPTQGKGQFKQNEYKSKIRNLAAAQKAYDHYDKGAEHHAKGRYGEALTEYKAALKIRRNMAKPHHGMGLVYQMQGKNSQAISEYKKAIAIDPDYIFPYNSLGMAYMKAGHYDDAVSALQKAVQLYQNFVDAHANLGEAYYKSKQYPTAIDSLEMAITLNEKHPRAHTTLGLTYEATGNAMKAIEEYEKAIALAPEDGYTGTARQRLAKIKKAN
ncbi:M48 family metalloprotease [Candidatus Poribacteria bacterium]